MCLALKESTKLSSRVTIPFYILTSSVWYPLVPHPLWHLVFSVYFSHSASNTWFSCSSLPALGIVICYITHSIRFVVISDLELAFPSCLMMFNLLLFIIGLITMFIPFDHLHHFCPPTPLAASGTQSVLYYL